MNDEVKQKALDELRTQISVNTANINELLSQLTVLSTPQAIDITMADIEPLIDELSSNVLLVEKLLTQY